MTDMLGVVLALGLTVSCLFIAVRMAFRPVPLAGRVIALVLAGLLVSNTAWALTHNLFVGLNVLPIAILVLTFIGAIGHEHLKQKLR